MNDVTLLLTALESRIRRLMAALARVAGERDRLRDELQHARPQTAALEERCGRWEQERAALGQRIERLLKELDTLSPHESEGTEDPHELADRVG
ncbi:MAG: hypothetical protein HY207_01635 [Nitrospirae bacterium]|nr:hypothetical protein [Nitrospirota bacterium]